MAPRPFLVNVAAVRRSPGVRWAEHRQGRIPDLVVTGSRVVAGSEVGIDAVLEVVSGGIVVVGTVSATWEGECRRCLRPVTDTMTVDVREIYEPRTGIREARESIEAEEETYPLPGDQLDLMPLARDAVLLHLPPAPLCRPECAGLCPECGVDRNDEVCHCSQAARDERWSALDALPGRDTS